MNEQHRESQTAPQLALLQVLTHLNEAEQQLCVWANFVHSCHSWPRIGTQAKSSAWRWYNMDHMLLARFIYEHMHDLRIRVCSILMSCSRNSSYIRVETAYGFQSFCSLTSTSIAAASNLWKYSGHWIIDHVCRDDCCALAGWSSFTLCHAGSPY